MARKRKTMTGQAAQPIGAVAGQEYGAGIEQMAMQRAMPAPQVSGVAAGAPGAPAPAPGGTPPRINMAELMQRAQALQPETGLLTAPTNRPTEPVTAGLSRGPGPGPEALAVRRGSPAGEMLRKLSMETGDPMFARLADQAKA
jgi:hypothetical protein